MSGSVFFDNRLVDFEFFGGSPRATFKNSGSSGYQLLAVNAKAGNIYYNGKVIPTGSNSAFTNKELDRLFSAGGVAFYDGVIAEFVVFNRQLTVDEMTRVNAYLSKKWGLTSTVDSDNDGFTDAIEIANGSTVTDSSSTPANIPAVIAGAELWLDATNIDGQNNATITDGDTVATWNDLSGEGIVFDQSQSNKPSLITDGGMNYVAFNQSSDNNEHLYYIRRYYIILANNSA